MEWKLCLEQGFGGVRPWAACNQFQCGRSSKVWSTQYTIEGGSMVFRSWTAWGKKAIAQSSGPAPYAAELSTRWERGK